MARLPHVQDANGRARTFLLIIGDRAALAWVLNSGKMAFPDDRRRETRSLAVGDRLLVYTTRGCFKNPTRDRGRIIGEATVESKVAPLPAPVRFGGRAYPVGCDLKITGLVPLPEGVPLAEYVHQLEAFPNPQAWAIRLRRPLLGLSETDAGLLQGLLQPQLQRPAKASAGYLRWLTDS